MDKKLGDKRIRKVRVLGDALRKKAKSQGLAETDLVLVTTTIHKGRPPTYELERVDGSPTEWLLNRSRKQVNGPLSDEHPDCDHFCNLGNDGYANVCKGKEPWSCQRTQVEGQCQNLCMSNCKKSDCPNYLRICCSLNRPTSKKPEPKIHTHEEYIADLDEMIEKGKKDVNEKRQKIALHQQKSEPRYCNVCGSAGMATTLPAAVYNKNDSVFPVCKKCKGKGRSHKVHTRSDGRTEFLTCKQCYGTGHGKFDSRKCPKCGGKWETDSNSPFCWCSKCKYEPGNDDRWVIERQNEIIREIESKLDARVAVKDEAETLETFQKAVIDYIDKPYDPKKTAYFRLDLRGKVFVKINDLKHKIYQLEKAQKDTNTLRSETNDPMIIYGVDDAPKKR